MLDPEKFSPLLQSFPQGIVAFDLETTGLSPLMDRIIEVACLKITPSGLDIFQSLINPQIPIPEYTTSIHGIRDKDVEKAPCLLDILPQLKNFMGEFPLIAHNIKFDAGFLIFASHRLHFPLGNNECYCTVKASRQAFSEMPNHKLSTLAKELHIPLENHHRAKDDALVCASIFAKAMEKSHRKEAPKNLLPALLKASKLFSLGDFSKNKFPKLPPHLQVLKKKVQNQILVDIIYKGGSHKGKWRPIKPISLLPMPRGNILYALCLLSNLTKSFALSKIQEVKELKAYEITERYKKLEKIRKSGY